MTYRSSVAVRLLLTAITAIGLIAATGSDRPVEPSRLAQPRTLPGPADILWADPTNAMYSYGPTEHALLMAPAVFTSNISVTYDAGFQAVPQAQAAFQAAVDIWRSIISSPAPIRINAFYQNLGNPNILGSAGPSVLCTASGGVSNTYYAAALADKLNGSAFCAALAGKTNEINANFNNTFPNWDFGTSGTPVPGTYNFMTVVLHEIGHGLGFYGSMTATGGNGSYRSTPDIYDRFAVTGGGAPLLGFASPSLALGSQLVSNNTFFNGTSATASNNGSNPKLETHNFTTAYGIASDNGWKQGSSYSHLDDVAYSLSPNGLMTFALAQAEVYTNPGPITRAIFADEGWGPSTLGSNPTLVIDGPPPGGIVGASFNVSGWAIDQGATSGTGIDAIHVYAYLAGGGPGVFLGAASYGAARPDIGSAFGSQFTNSGYSLSASGLANGSYQITAYGRSTVTGTFNVARSVDVTVSGPVSNPAMTLDGPSSNSTSGQTVTIAGWAIDRGAPSGTGVDTVHVWAFPSGGGAATFLGAATYGLSRPDIGAAFGNQFTNSGFRVAVVVPAGNYTINAYMHSTVANAFNVAVGAVNVTVNTTDSNAVLFVDTPAQNAIIGRPFPISGWAVDSGAPTGTGIDAIHVWAFPTNGAPSFFAGVATYGSSRPDIGALYGNGRFTNSGLSFTVTTGNLPTAGGYDLYVFGHSTVTGGFTVARIVRVTVQ